MPDFTSLLSKPAGEAKKPEALAVGQYPGVIKSYELGDQNKNKTPYVRFSLGLSGWPDGADPQTNADGSPIDLTKRGFRRDFYLTEEALWRLDELLNDLQIDLAGRTYAEALPEVIGQQVLVEIQQYLTQNNEIGNQVGAVSAIG